MFAKLVCPVSAAKIDSHASRLTTFLNVGLMINFLTTRQVAPLLVVAVDYGIRALGYNQYSPLGFFAALMMKLVRAKAKMVPKAPKMFASRLGFICAVFGIAFILAGQPVAALAMIGLFSALAVLDSVFNFCAGCLIYTRLVYPFFEKKAPQSVT